MKMNRVMDLQSKRRPTDTQPKESAPTAKPQKPWGSYRKLRRRDAPARHNATAVDARRTQSVASRAESCPGYFGASLGAGAAGAGAAGAGWAGAGVAGAGAAGVAGALWPAGGVCSSGSTAVRVALAK